MTDLQGCRLWSHPPELEEMELSKTQKALVGTGLTGPGLDSEIALQTKSQPQLHCAGFDERQLRMLKAQIRNKRADFHEIIDQAVNAVNLSGQLSTAELLVTGGSFHSAATGGSHTQKYGSSTMQVEIMGDSGGDTDQAIGHYASTADSINCDVVTWI